MEEKKKKKDAEYSFVLWITQVLPKHLLGRNRYRIFSGHTHTKSSAGEDIILL